MSLIGRHTSRLASSTNVSPEERAAIRSALGTLLDGFRHDLVLVSDALGGTDPEYALSLYVDLVHEAPGRLRLLEEALAAARRLRVAA
jgi:hypothetical protein